MGHIGCSQTFQSGTGSYCYVAFWDVSGWLGNGSLDLAAVIIASLARFTGNITQSQTKRQRVYTDQSFVKETFKTRFEVRSGTRRHSEMWIFWLFCPVSPQRILCRLSGDLERHVLATSNVQAATSLEPHYLREKMRKNSDFRLLVLRQLKELKSES